MRRSRELSPVTELLIRLLIVTAVAAATLPFVVTESHPAERNQNDQVSGTVLREGGHE